MSAVLCELAGFDKRQTNITIQKLDSAKTKFLSDTKISMA